MLTLALAFVAGVLTILAPCTLPVVPLVLGGASLNGRRRAVGVVLGFGISFVVTAVLLAGALAAAGVTTGLLRTISAVVLALVGLSLVVPAIALRVEGRLAPMGRLAARLPGAGDGWPGGLATGAAIGLLWAPCVGPLMAATLALAIAQGPTAGGLAVAVAYTIGAALPLLLVAGLGRAAVRRLGGARTRFRLQQAGLAMVLASVAALTGLDAALAAPSFVRLAGDPGPVATGGAASPAPDAVALEDLGPAPELTGIAAWLNSSPLTLASLRGKVVLLHFWTFACINCQHVQPYIKAWWSEFKTAGLVVIGVHTPELSFERDLGNVQAAVSDDGVTFPVAFDPGFATWSAFHNRYWPAMYFIGRDGRIRHLQEGEGGYAESEQVIRELLAEPG